MSCLENLDRELASDLALRVAVEAIEQRLDAAPDALPLATSLEILLPSSPGSGRSRACCASPRRASSDTRPRTSTSRPTRPSSTCSACRAWGPACYRLFETLRAPELAAYAA